MKSTFKDYVTTALEGLTPSQSKAFAKLNALLSSSKLARWQFGHGFITSRPKAKHAAIAMLAAGVTGYTEGMAKRDLGDIARVLNEMQQAGLMAGEVIAARATMSGNLSATHAKTVLGMALVASMENLVGDAVNVLLGGGAPNMLLVPATSSKDATVKIDGDGYKYDFRLARAAVKLCGVDTKGITSATLPGIIASIVKANAKPQRQMKRKAKDSTPPANVTPITEGASNEAPASETKAA